jgi:hypothetical protein
MRSRDPNQRRQASAIFGLIVVILIVASLILSSVVSLSGVR